MCDSVRLLFFFFLVRFAWRLRDVVGRLGARKIGVVVATIG